MRRPKSFAAHCGYFQCFSRVREWETRMARSSELVRVLLGLGLLGMAALCGGCGGGTTGESNVSPTTPPPGLSGKEQADARANSFPAGKQAPAKKN